MLEVQHDTPLIAVHRQKGDRFFSNERGTHSSGIVATVRFFDLDHVGAHVGEQHAAKRTGKDLGAVENSHTVECFGHAEGVRKCLHVLKSCWSWCRSRMGRDLESPAGPEKF